MDDLRSLWEQIQHCRRSRDSRKLWQRFADWDTAFEILFIIAVIIYVLVSSTFGR
jgi:hypothetical protein